MARTSPTSRPTSGLDVVAEEPDPDGDGYERVHDHEGGLRCGDRTDVEGVLSQEHPGQARHGQSVGRPGEEDVAPAPVVISSFIVLMSAAVKAKAMAPAVPNHAAFHAGDPNRVSRTAMEHPAMTAKDTIPQSSRSGVSLPPPGAGSARKAANPPAAALAPDPLPPREGRCGTRSPGWR